MLHYVQDWLYANIQGGRSARFSNRSFRSGPLQGMFLAVLPRRQTGFFLNLRMKLGASR